MGHGPSMCQFEMLKERKRNILMFNATKFKSPGKEKKYTCNLHFVNLPNKHENYSQYHRVTEMSLSP